MQGAIGPKVSSVITCASGGTSASTVGWKNQPRLPSRAPPVASRAPRSTASFKRLHRRQTAAIGQRTHLHALHKAVPHLQLFRLMRQGGHEIVIDALMDQKA